MIFLCNGRCGWGRSEATYYYPTHFVTRDLGLRKFLEKPKKKLSIGYDFPRGHLCILVVVGVHIAVVLTLVDPSFEEPHLVFHFVEAIVDAIKCIENVTMGRVAANMRDPTFHYFVYPIKGKTQPMEAWSNLPLFVNTFILRWPLHQLY